MPTPTPGSPITLGPIQLFILALSIVGLILGLKLPPKYAFINFIIDILWIGLLIASIALGFTF
jgi:hypothetical protein